MFALPSEPGSLFRALSVFAMRKIDLSKLESRPSRERAWEYVFWIELDADARQPATARAIDALGRVTTMVRVLGSCPRAADPA